MKRALIAWILAFIFSSIAPAQQKLTTASLPAFLGRCDRDFAPVETAIKDLAGNKPPLRNAEGRPMAHQYLEDEFLLASNLRRTARQLAAKPDDAVLVATVVLRTETLADDLFDLSQEAFDNGREELGDRLNRLQMILRENNSPLSEYLLALVAEKEERLQQLEKEVEELHQKLKETSTSHEPGKP